MTDFVDLVPVLSLSRGWSLSHWNDRPVLAAHYGGNEARFTLGPGPAAAITIATDRYVFCHVLLDGSHLAAIGPGEQPAVVNLPPLARDGLVRVIRTACSSGPFYVSSHLIDIECSPDRVSLPATPVPATVFSTFGDSISGNTCIGPPEGPFDPYGLGYGYPVCDHFGWQYLNAARDGSAVCCRPFANPVAAARLQFEVIDMAPDALVVFYGTNDIRSSIPADRFGRDFSDLIGRIVGGLPAARIILSGLLWNDMSSDSDITAYNQQIARIAARANLPFVDARPLLGPSEFWDGVHPNKEGQAKLACAFIRAFECHYGLRGLAS